MCLSDELYLYSIMPLPALSTNEPRAKHANRSFALRPAPCKTRMRAPAATDVRSCAAVLLRLLHYFLLCSLFIALFALFLAPWFPPYEKHQGQMPWRVAPQVRLELTTLRLTAECSAIELLRIIRGLWRDSFACPAACLSASGTFTLGFGSRPGFALRFCLALAPPRLRRSPRPASARRPVLPYVLGAGKTFVPPAPLGSRQLPTLPSRSQLSTISVWRLNFCVRYGYRWCPPAIVTGNFPQGSFSRSPLPAPSKLHSN